MLREIEIFTKKISCLKEVKKLCYQHLNALFMQTNSIFTHEVYSQSPWQPTCGIYFWSMCSNESKVLNLSINVARQRANQPKIKHLFLFFALFAIFILHLRESELYCYTLDGKSASLGSCLFRGLWATCLPYKGGGIPLSSLLKYTISELAGLFSTTSHKCRAPRREAIDTIF